MRSIRNTVCLRSHVSHRRLTYYSGIKHARIETAIDQDHQKDFFRYTSGRWLWNEDARLKERFRKFNVKALQEIAISCTSAERCISMTKLAEGGFNKIFRLVMDNDAVLIARIPTSNPGPSSRTIASEVATMDFASTVLGIPVPKVLAWNASEDNPVQSEYIIMEEAYGVPLRSIWNSLDVEVKAKVVEQIVSIVSKLLSISFLCYGSIYFSANKFPGCKPAVVHGSLAQDVKAEVKDRYVIGPVVERSFWDEGRGNISAVQGPWNTPEEYLKAIATREMTWLSKYGKHMEKTITPFQPQSSEQPEQHISLYEKFLAISDLLLPKDPELVRSTLWHWDLHAPNIFIKGNKITSIIDWQDCWVGPLVLQARRPRLVDFQGDLMLQLPQEYKSLEDGQEKQQIRSSVEKSILLFSYESELQRANPVMERIFNLPQISTIRDAIAFSANTWDGGIVPFRQALIQIHWHWSQINPARPCPFSFTQSELDAFKEEGDSWNENAEFWSSISGLVGRDGFVLNEDYDEAFDMFARLREEGLQMLSGEEREQFDEATTWAIRK